VRLLHMTPALAEYADLVAALAEDAPERVRLSELLRAEAEGFATAGGQWSADDWAGMADLERAAAIAAGGRVWLHRAALLVEALGYAEGAAALRAPIDGGEAMQEVALGRAIAAVLAKEGQR